MYIEFNSISDTADLWLYAFDRNLSENESQIVDGMFRQFTENWLAHNNPVRGSFKLLENRFLILAAEAKATSGCSIDSSVSILKELHTRHDINALDQSLIHFRKAGKIVSVTRPEFKALVLENKIDHNTTVFDLSLQTVGDFRSGRFEIPFTQSWQATVWKPAVSA